MGLVERRIRIRTSQSEAGNLENGKAGIERFVS